MATIRKTASSWKTALRHTWSEAKALWQLPTDDDLS